MRMRVTAPTHHQSLADLSRLGRLLDEAVDIADRSAETLLAAQIAQALHTLDTRVAVLRDVPMTRDPRPATPDGDGFSH